MLADFVPTAGKHRIAARAGENAHALILQHVDRAVFGYHHQRAIRTNRDRAGDGRSRAAKRSHAIHAHADVHARGAVYVCHVQLVDLENLAAAGGVGDDLRVRAASADRRTQHVAVDRRDVYNIWICHVLAP